MPQIKIPGRAVVICFIVAALLASCGPVTPNPAPTLAPTKTPVPTNTPVPPATPTPAGPAVTFEKPSLWNTYDPKDPGLPELIIPDGNGFRLDPEWQAGKIEYVYRAWTASEGGLASRSALGHEIIQQSGSDYLWGEKRVSAEKVKALLSAITDLHPAQSLLVGVFHTDEYPTWQLELTGADGNQILLYSASDENPGFGPWNVIYNGRIYAQYDGTMGPVIGKLFDGTDDSFIWKSDEPGYHPSDMVGFATSGLPNQLSYGFVGLLPIASSFDYSASLADAEIQGYIRIYNWFESRDITALSSVVLTVDGKKEACTLKKPNGKDAYDAKWAFACKLEAVAAGQRYRYPIRIELGAKTGEKFVTTGELRGIWREPDASLALPPSEEIQAAMAENPDLQDLLKDHVFYAVYYTGKFQLEKDQSPALLGEIILKGQASVANYNIPYTITVPFGIIDKRFVEWGLTRPALQRLISDVFKISLTSRIYKQLPDTTLNLWYVTHNELDDFPAMPSLLGPSIPSYFGVNLPQCGKNPAIAFPANQQPLRAFGFMSVDFGDATTFVLAGNEAIPYGMNLFPATDADELIPYLAPKELMRNGEIPFDHIQYEHLSKPAKTTYTFYLELQPHDETKDAANSIANSLPVKVDKQFGPYWSATDTGIVMNNDGSLSIVSCPVK
ncbi:MAG: hypothetical protein WA821_02735 [Anaerolineales bacterium]